MPKAPEIISGRAGCTPRLLGLFLSPAFPLLPVSQAQAHLGSLPFPQVSARGLLSCQGTSPLAKRSLSFRENRVSQLWGLVPTLKPNPWGKVSPHSLHCNHRSPTCPMPPRTLPFTPNHPWTEVEGVSSQDNIFHFFHFFINQIIQNNHHSLNARAPSWSSPKVTPPSASPSACSLSSPALVQRQSWEEAGAEREPGRHSTGQTTTVWVGEEIRKGRFSETLFSTKYPASFPAPFFKSFPVAHLLSALSPTKLFGPYTILIPLASRHIHPWPPPTP